MARILLVSTDEAVHETLVSLARRRGHTLCLAAGLASPASAGLRDEWDAAFIDVSAACSEGLAAVSIARESDPKLPVAAIDTGGDPAGLDRLARAVRLGAVEFMRMPIDQRDGEALMDRLRL